MLFSLDIVLSEAADCLSDGLRQELFLTPKPGLVDLLDAGSHADLSVPLMLESIDLVSAGYQEFARQLSQGVTARELVPAARALEKKLFDTLGTNTHKGAIFLGGLLLCALSQSAQNGIGLQAAVMEVAIDLLRFHDTGATNGARIRKQRSSAGVLHEAGRGLPALFQTALPALTEARAQGWGETRVGLFVMARLMQIVEDSTTLHRAGASGLQRLREDGSQLETLLLARLDPYPFLHATNQSYRNLNLTMGGVADLLAMTYAVSNIKQRSTQGTFLIF